ncbi:MAG TPA: 2Fe-2S iron-sulfur cluster-binding protein, partial [Candidatus Sulfomarinibacteraceae bacterium]|nr:2Fe-2S iron-sulfur cluster-binding protein [Candidatus Sulfomarinibacteraceae bacterium]
MPTLALVLNGRPTSVDHDEGMSLLDVLREPCGLHSPKDGCSQGMCGCCTVLLDGRPTLACQLRPGQVAGREIVTLEGLTERMRQLLADAFLREGAVQCGFCTPGIAVRASHLIGRGLTARRERIERGLAGHLCRCTGYHRIVDA